MPNAAPRFTADTLKFLRALKRNNRREWFNAHRDIFTNLVDFDTLYGHRNDVAGYARNLERLDARMPQLLASLRPDDLLILTGDHGCDPSDESTDHTREFVPLIAAGAKVRPGALGDRTSFSDIAATIGENFSLSQRLPGNSFLKAITS